MPTPFRCPRCGSASAERGWCPSCRQPFSANNPEPPDVLPVAEDEPLEALPADEAPIEAELMPEATAPQLSLAPEVLSLTKSHLLAERPPAQRLLYALLAISLIGYKGERLLYALALLAVPCLLVLGIVAGFLLMTVAHWLLTAAAWVAGTWVHILIFAIPIVAFIVARLAKHSAEEPEVRLDRDGEQVTGLRLGRLHEVFHVGQPGALALYFGACFAFQAGLLYFAPEPMGLAGGRVFSHCWLVALDNVCHGIFLDTFEIYKITIGDPIEHTYFSSTVFYAFRLSYDALFVLLLWEGYQRFRMRRLFARLPSNPRDISGVCYWLDRCAIDRQSWPRRFFDEFIFLLLVRGYLNGNYRLVKEVSRQFPWLAVDDEVRALFVNTDGEVVFQKSPQGG
jgi:hypothetical protein